MKKIAVLMMLVFAVVTCSSCGSNTSSGDTTPNEAKVLALGGILMGLATNYVALTDSFVQIDAQLQLDVTSGTFTDETTTYGAYTMGGDASDIVTWSTNWSGARVPATVSARWGDVTTHDNPLTYTETMAGYPDGSDPETATIEWNSEDYDLTATSTTISGSLYGEMTLSRTTGDIISISDDNGLELVADEIDIVGLDPDGGAFTGSVHYGTNSQDAISVGMTVRAATETDKARLLFTVIATPVVEYQSTTYYCTVVLNYTGRDSGESTNTGLGEMTVASATCR